jgi:hypothetical protein
MKRLCSWPRPYSVANPRKHFDRVIHIILENSDYLHSLENAFELPQSRGHIF